MAQQLQTHIQKALDYLLREYTHFQEFKKDLEQLAAIIQAEKSKENKSFKKLFKDFKYIARAERRFNRFIIKVEDDFKQLLQQEKDTRSKAELVQLEKNLEIGGRHILAAASLHEGSIKHELTQIYQSYLIQTLVYRGQDDFSANLHKLEDAVSNALRWIGALTTDLEKARKLTFTASDTIMPGNKSLIPVTDTALSSLVDMDVGVINFSSLPTGTHKFLKAQYTLRTARGKVLGAITAGNYGLALKLLHQAHYPEKELHLFLNDKTDQRIIQGLQGRNIFVHQVNLQKEWLGKQQMEKIIGKKITDITHLSYAELTEAYKYLSASILGASPTTLFCPIGSGELMSFIKKSKLPLEVYGNPGQVYGVVPRGHPFAQKNIIFTPMPQSLADGLVTPWISQEINSVLARLGVKPLEVDEADLLAAYKLAKKVGYDVEISGAAGFVGLLPKYVAQLKLVKKSNKLTHLEWQKLKSPSSEDYRRYGGDSIVIICTGNGHRYFGI